MAGVVTALPLLETAAPKRDSDGSAGTLIRLVSPAFESRFSEGFDDPVLSRTAGGPYVRRNFAADTCTRIPMIIMQPHMSSAIP